MRKHKSIFLSLSIAIILLLTVAVIYWHPFLSRQDAEHEIASFMTDLLVKQGPLGVEVPEGYLSVQEYKSPIEHTETSDQPWLNASQQTTIIIWASPTDNFNVDKNLSNLLLMDAPVLRLDAPISVWWYFNNTLVTAKDKTEAIAKYAELFMSDAPKDGCPYNFSRFGILSLSGNKRDAKVFVAVTNGPLCGMETILLLHQHLFGKWEIIGTEGFARS
jgi:hypothetical protein